MTSGTLAAFAAVTLVALLALQHTTPLLSHTNANFVYLPSGGTLALASPIFLGTFYSCDGRKGSVRFESGTVLERRYTAGSGHCLIHALCGDASSRVVRFEDHPEVRQFYVTYLRKYQSLAGVQHETVNARLKSMLGQCIDPTPGSRIPERELFIDNIKDRKVMANLWEYENLRGQDRNGLTQEQRTKLNEETNKARDVLCNSPVIWEAYLKMLEQSPSRYFNVDEIAVFAQMTQTNIHVWVANPGYQENFTFEPEDVTGKPSFGSLDKIGDAYIHFSRLHYEACRQRCIGG